MHCNALFGFIGAIPTCMTLQQENIILTEEETITHEVKQCAVLLISCITYHHKYNHHVLNKLNGI